jgi:hypothetical protein
MAAIPAAGLFPAVSGKVLSAGLTVTVLVPGDEGPLMNVGAPLLAVPRLYLGVRLPVVGVGLFARGSFLPRGLGIGTNGGLLLGFGTGWDRTLSARLNLKVLARYDAARNFSFFDSDTIGLSVLASWVRIRHVRPFVVVGLENTWMRVPLLRVPPGAGPFRMSQPSFSAGLGAALFRTVYVEADLWPRLSVSLSAGYSR